MFGVPPQQSQGRLVQNAEYAFAATYRQRHQLVNIALADFLETPLILAGKIRDLDRMISFFAPYKYLAPRHGFEIRKPSPDLLQLFSVDNAPAKRPLDFKEANLPRGIRASEVWIFGGSGCLFRRRLFPPAYPFRFGHLFYEMMKLEAVVVFKHRFVRNRIPASLTRRNTFSGILPWRFEVGQILEPLGRFVAIVLKNGIYGFFFILCEIADSPARPIGYLKFALMKAIQFRYYGAIRPGFDSRLEQRSFVPYQ